MTILRSVEELEAIYGVPGEASIVKEVPEIIPQYRTFIETSPFCTLATVGPEGLDCSPRGDVPGFVRVHDDRTLMMPDRRGNNRADSLKNIIRDPRVALCFLIPGSRTALRVNGEATVSIDPELKQSFLEKGKEPRSVIVIKTTAVYFQCGRAVVRSKLWDQDAQVDPDTLPTPGDVLAELSNGRVGGKEYDEKWEGRAKETLW
ncbi:MAG: pyridoxamine 5'-phosphate oxidase family protein [Rhizobiaceae bacterium]|nr:pyridoxamine 5'-phosphate oxidase family protein [Rhizobiaceae bacterium]